ncbi:MAG: response regulator [Planctomycetaceae bacterium]|nr:response regulator [Planctomycetaceae bacterium]
MAVPEQTFEAVAQSESERRASPECILVVEDDAALRRLIEKSLAANGYRTCGAADGKSALANLGDCPPRLMLLDYSLPDMRGEQLLERLEALGKHVPFIVATGHGSESVAVAMMKRGAYDYLVKGPTFMKLLPVVVGQALERVRQAERLSEAEERLRRAHEELEQRVRQRTAELAEANQRLLVEMEERRRAEERAIQHQAELGYVARLSTVGEMVLELTHELNQPLSAICSYAQACKRLLGGNGQRPDASSVASDASDGDPVQELSASLNQISEQGDRAGEIIRRLRRFVNKGKPLQLPLDMNALIHEVSGLMNLDARMAEAEITFELTDPLPLVVGDRIQLEQVLFNLLRNAFDSLRESPPGGRRVSVRTTLDGEDDILVAVEDNGAGVSPEVAPLVFDRFFTTKPAGMGVGLSISRSIVESHGGKLWVGPAARRGAIFRFTLPIDRGE